MAVNTSNSLYKDLKGNANDFDSSLGSNPNYRVYMWKGDPLQGVSTAMPENWSTSLDIGWQPQFANILKEAAGVAIGQAKAEFASNILASQGYMMQNKALASNIWNGQSYMTISIPFIFKVQSDVEKELLKPIRKLMAWALPSTKSIANLDIALEAPYRPFHQLDVINPLSKNSASTQTVPGTWNPVTIQFGNFFTLPKCVITSINQTYDSIFDADGKPLSAKLDVTVISTTIITAQDIQSMFLLESAPK
jgi:hypothetical protein